MNVAVPIRLDHYPSAVIHFDGDAFFTSVEQSVRPALKGRPVVTGKERGIIACASYEAKALGIKRGVALWEARRMCPDLVVLPSDYETYSLYSKRMFDIVRRFTPVVEEHSIDEGFADLAGLRRVHHASYEDISRRIQEAVRAELDITVSVGLSLTKSLAKLASKYRKPRGFTAVAGCHIHRFLPRIPLDGVWGFGPNTTSLLQKHGLRTAADFVAKPEAWAAKLLGKIGREIWNELRGEVQNRVSPEGKTAYLTISKCKTFTAPSSNPDFIRAKLVRNVESAFIKLRRHRLRVSMIAAALRTTDYRQEGLEAKLSRPTDATPEVMPLVADLFERLYRPGGEYRSTMIVLAGLEPAGGEQLDLFEDRLRIDNMNRASRAIDEVNRRFGKHKLALGTSLFLGEHETTDRDELPVRKTALLPGETPRRRLGLPRLMIDV